MLTKLTIRNFKRFDRKKVEIELGDSVVFLGPNNSGKTTAMQALALWHVGVRRWFEKRKGNAARKSSKGVTIGRRDLVSVPVPHANLLWHQHHTRNVYRDGAGKQHTDNIRIEVVVEGVEASGPWACGLEFDYTNEESFYCRPLRKRSDGENRMEVPDQAKTVQVALLPPMSGLVTAELRLEPGAVNVKIGEGRTAEVLRNLCYRIAQSGDDWDQLAKRIESLFGICIEKPHHMPDRGEITMSYEENGVRLDLSSSGRGLQQTLLILAYMHANPGAVLLLDEPDAHLEILRQRDIYQLLAETASGHGSQIIAASHSEVILDEAAVRDDPVIAFVGAPHRMLPDRMTQVRKALANLGFEQYYQAEQTGWVLYLEGHTDLAILRTFAEQLGHEEAQVALKRPFVHYVGNQPRKAADHYFGLREALPQLQGVALYDRFQASVRGQEPLMNLMWKRREIENYLCTPVVLEAYAEAQMANSEPAPLLDGVEAEQRRKAMQEAISEVESAMKTLGRGSPWGTRAKVSEDFLEPVFVSYFKRLKRYNTMPKKNFYKLVAYIPDSEIDPEIIEKLDAIAQVAKQARPRS